MVYGFGVRWIAMRLPGSSWDRPWTLASALARRELPEAVVYELSVPGYRRKDLTIEVRDGVVTIRGERGRRWFERRRANESFTESFSLPETLDEQSIDAELRAGVLTLTVAKKPHARARRIPVRAVRGPSALTTQAAESGRASSPSMWGRLRAWWRAHAPSAAH